MFAFLSHSHRVTVKLFTLLVGYSGFLCACARFLGRPVWRKINSRRLIYICNVVNFKITTNMSVTWVLRTVWSSFLHVMDCAQHQWGKPRYDLWLIISWKRNSIVNNPCALTMEFLFQLIISHTRASPVVATHSSYYHCIYIWRMPQINQDRTNCKQLRKRNFC